MGSGVGVGECAVRMAKAGALLVGVNCLFDPFICLEVLKTMKVALEAFELTPYLMAQPLGYRVPDGGSFGWVEIPEFPFSVEPRQITRWEARKWARQAFELGVRYIGGCCGFEPYHIRAMAEELADVRGGLPEATSKRPTSLNSSLLPVRPSCHTSRSPQLILVNFVIKTVFMNIYCHSCDVLCQPGGE